MKLNIMRMINGSTAKIGLDIKPRSLLVLAFSFLFTSATLANPVLGNVVSGASVQQTQHTTTINQSSQKAVLNWQSFNIGAGEATHFNQPAGGVALNRISPALGASQIYGVLTATGRIILVNPAGIYFGSSAVVNVGGIIASTANITDQNFLNGNYQFDRVNGYSGSIINDGRIVAANGLVALMAQGVVNNGLIEANVGRVIMASGDAYTMGFSGDGLVNFAITAKTSSRGVDKNGNPLSAGVTNTGAIYANGGKVLVTARAVSGVLDNSINMHGVVLARSAAQDKNGTITISGDPNYGKVRIASSLDASGARAGEKGGKVSITGHDIVIDSPTLINVSGNAGGGSIVIGKDAAGQLANKTTILPGVKLLANAYSSGDGGFVETSGHQLNIAGLSVDLSAPSGKAGTWLLDPADLSIVASGSTTASQTGDTFNPDGVNSTLLVSDLIAALSSSNVTIETTVDGIGGNGDIFVETPINWASSNNLILSAYRNITSTASITNTGGASVVLQADNSGTGTGTVSFTVGNNVALSGGTGTVNIYYNPTVFGTQNTIYTGGTTSTRYMLINSLGNATDTTTPSLATLSNRPALWNQNFALSKDIDASATSSWNGGDGFSPIGNYSTGLFTGKFDGQGHVISNLNITPSSAQTDVVGLFGASSGTIQNVGLVNEHLNLTLTFGYGAGGLVGDNYGTVNNVFSTGTLNISGSTGNFNAIGGLIGYSEGIVNNTYSGSTVIGTGIDYIGGLVGQNFGSINHSYSAGTVNGSSNNVGGLTGINFGSVTNSFWDMQTSGRSTSAGGIGKTTAQLLTLSTYSNAGWNIGTDPAANTWLMFDGQTRPMLAMEYSSTISTAHALQLTGINAATLGGNYTLNNNIDLSSTATPADVWAGQGFIPIGNTITPFTGSFDGLGHSLDNLTATVVLVNGLNPRSGLFGNASNAASISNINLNNINIAFLLNQSDLTLCASCAASTNSNFMFSVSELNHLLSGSSSNVSLQTSSTLFDVLGNISIEAPITWGSNSSLDLIAYRNIASSENITNTGGGSVRLQADTAGLGTGTVSPFTGGGNVTAGEVNIYYNPVNFGLQDTIYIGGTTPIQYMLINSLGNASDTTGASLATLANTPAFWNENFALNNNIDASSTLSWNSGDGFTPIGNTITPFSGKFDSLGHSISHLAISFNINSVPVDGLFGVVSTPSPSFNFNVSGTAKGFGNTILGLQSTNLAYQVDASGIHFTHSGTPSNFILSLLPADLEICTSCSTTPNIITANASQLSLNTSDLTDLLFFGNVKLQTAGTLGVLGDILVNAPISWNTNSQLDLSAYGNITSDATITNTAGGNVRLQADNTGTGTGTVSFTSGNNVALSGGAGTVKIYYNPVTFGTQDTIYTGGTAPTQFMLINSLGLETDSSSTTNARSLATFSNSPAYWSQNFALSKDIDASDTVNWNGGLGFSKIGEYFGKFDGLGHTISNLTLSNANGLFGGNFGTISNIGLINEKITSEYNNGVGGLVGINFGSINNAFTTGSLTLLAVGSYTDAIIFNANAIGGLAGHNSGTIENAYSSITVTVIGTRTSIGGGLVGANSGSINNSYSTGTVNGPFDGGGGFVGFNKGTINNAYSTGTVNGSTNVGGLIGANSGSVSNAYGTGAVNGSYNVGGLIGWNKGTINNAYSTGAVSGTIAVGGSVGLNEGTVNHAYSSGAVSGLAAAGGLIGLDAGGSVTNSFWDMQTSGRIISEGGIGKTTAQLLTLSTYSNAGWNIGTNPDSNTWLMFDGQTRPMLAMEYSSTIATAHALQLTGINVATLGGSYTLNNNINLSSALNPADVWAGKGFIPIGNTIMPFTGSFDGSGYTINHLALTANSLFGAISPVASFQGLNLDFALLNRNLTICLTCGVSSDTNLMLPVSSLTNLLAIANISLQTSATPTNGLGNISINTPIDWSSSSSLNLSAYRNIISNNANITNTGGGSVRLQADNSGLGTGTVKFLIPGTHVTAGAVNIYYNPAVFGIQDTIYTGGTTPTQYMLINSLANLATLSNTSAFWNKNFALNKNIDASATAAWNSGAGFTPIGNTITPFSGKFDSLGHSISHLAISFNINSIPTDGLFGVVSTPSPSFNFNVSGIAKASGNTILGPQSANLAYQVDASGIHFTYSNTPSNFILSLLPADLTICTSCSTTANITTSNASQLALNASDLTDLLFFGNVKLQTSGTLGVLGDILVNAPISWNTNSQLDLSAYGNITSDATITNTAGGNVRLQADNTGTGTGTVSFTSGNHVALSGGRGTVNIYYNPVTFGTQDTIYNGGTAPTQYMLINSLGLATDTTTASLATLSNTPALWNKNFALSKDIDASATSSWNSGDGFSPIGSSTAFTGKFDGQGHVISNLSLTPSIQTNTIGLFGSSGGTIQNIGLVNEYVNFTLLPHENAAGGLIGFNFGTVNNVFISNLLMQATGEQDNVVGGTNFVGGLIGFNSGFLGNVYITGSMSIIDKGMTVPPVVGGLVGWNRATINNVYSSVAVNGVGGNGVGGLVGGNEGTVNNAYSSGAVSGKAGVGGLIGFNAGTITNSFWDTQTSGQLVSAGGTGKTTAQLLTLSTYSNAGWNIGTDPSSNTWLMFDGQTRPMLAMEYSTNIKTAHALQLTGINAATLGGSYTLNNNIDLSGTANPADVWVGKGLTPIGNTITPFTGSFDGLGNTLSNITVALTNGLNPRNGIFGNTSNTASISNLTINNIAFLLNQSDLTLCDSCTASTNTNLMFPVSELNNLLSTGNVSLQTSSTLFDVLGNISIEAPITWGSNSSLDLIAYRNIASSANITNTGGGSVLLRADTAGLGTSTVSPFTGGGNVTAGEVNIYYNPVNFGLQDTIYAGGTTPDQYMLINSLGNASDTTGASLATLANTPAFWNEKFALNNNIDASATLSWNSGAGFTPIGNTITAFSGLFDGLGHIISRLTIDQPQSNVGLFGVTDAGAILSNIGVSGTFKGDSNVGALVGNNAGTVSSAFAQGIVVGTGSNVGGLVGLNSGNITDTNSLASVSGDSNVGGLVGSNSGSVANSFAAGYVNGNSNAGGLTGDNSGNIQNSFWDTARTGQSNGTGTNTGSLTNVLGGCLGGGSCGVDLSALGTFTDSGWDFTSTWGISGFYPYLLSLFTTAPQVISGQIGQLTPAYDFVPAAIPNQTVGLISNGNYVDTTQSGADGSYYFLEQQGTLADGSSLLVYLSNSANKGNTVTTVPGGSGSISNLFVLLNTLLAGDNGVPDYVYTPPGGSQGILSDNPLAGLLFTLVSNDNIAAALGTLSSSDLLFTASGTNISLNNNTSFVTSPNTILGLTGNITATNGDIVLKGPAAINPVSANVTLQTIGGGDIVLSHMVSATSLPYTLNLNSANRIVFNGQLILADNNSLGSRITSGSLNVSAAYTDQSITTSSNLYLNNFNLLQGKWFQTNSHMLVLNNFQINSGIMPSTQAEFLQVAGGSGTVGDPYQINTLEGLQGIGSNSYTLGLHYTYLNDIPQMGNTSLWNYDSATGQYAGFVPIGTAATPFTGSLSGQISGIYINRPTTDNVGLFGVTSVSALLSGVFLNSNAITGHDNVGALVGFNQGTINGLTGSSSNFVVGHNNVGGLVGVNNGSLTNVYAFNNRLIGNSGVGGLTGQNNGLIDQSYIANYVRGNSLTGGIAGINTGTIRNSFWDTDVTGQANATGSNQGILDHVTGGCLTGACTNGGTAALSDINTYLTSADGGYDLVSSSWSFGTNPGDWTLLQGMSYPFSSINQPTRVFSGSLSSHAANELLIALWGFDVPRLYQNTIRVNLVTGADGSFYYLAPESYFTFFPNIVVLNTVGGNISGSVIFAAQALSAANPTGSVTNIPLVTKPNGATTTTYNMALSDRQIINLVLRQPVNAVLGDFTYYYQQVYGVLYNNNLNNIYNDLNYQPGIYGAILGTAYNLFQNNYDFNIPNVLYSQYFLQNQDLYNDLLKYLEAHDKSLYQFLSQVSALDAQLLSKYDIQPIKPAFCGR